MLKIAGMIDESMDTEQLAGPPQPWEFRSKPAWQRLIVMLGGIFVNIVLGVFIFWMLTLKYGETFVPNDNVKYGIVPGIIGKEIGLKAGDKIVAVNGKPIKHFEELISSKVLLGNTQLTLIRDGNQMDVTVPGNILNDVSDYGIGEFVAPRTHFAIDSVVKGSNAQIAGLLKGDSIKSVNGVQVEFMDQLLTEMGKHKNQKVTLQVVRQNAPLQIEASVNKDGKLGFSNGNFGIALKPDEPASKTENYSFINALPIGATRAWGMFSDNAKGLGKVFKGELKFNKAVSGPVAMASMFGSHIDWFRFWGLVGLLSMALALMNLLPIPALDGGHALFLIIEMIKGKPLSDKFLERAQLVGFVILITLMVFVFGNDIVKHVIKK
jgi:regulator of sigma E protease